MRILTIIGSYRVKGNTARIVELIQEGMRARAQAEGFPLEFEDIFLGKQEIGFCRGCRVCFDKGEDDCPLQDDLLTIKSRMLVVDGILIATPVYVNDVSGTLKNFIDRLAHICHRPEFAGKSAYMVATVGLGPTSHALRTMKMALSSWGYHIAGGAGFKMGALMDQDDMLSQFGTKAEAIGTRFFDVIRRKEAATPSFLLLMTFRIQQGFWWREPDPGSVDYDYWVDKGWTSRQQDFYTPHQASRLKVAIARMAGAFLAPFVT
jgi:multimeric flavodoxin WrbA